MVALEEEGVAKAPQPITIGFWSCDLCGEGGSADDLYDAERRAVTHALVHRASSRMQRQSPICMRTWTAARVA